METGTPVFMKLAGSPYSSEDNTALWWNYLNSKKADPSTSTPHTDPKIQEYSQVYSQPGHSFYQIQHSLTSLYIEVNPENGLIGLTPDARRNSTFFQLIFVEKTSYLENVQTCLYLCLAINGTFYTGQSLFNDESCNLRLRFTSGEISNMSPATIRRSGNSTHDLMVNIVRQTNLRHLSDPQFKITSEWIKNKTQQNEHHFVFPPVSFESILSKISDKILPIFYNTQKRRSRYCPTEWKRQLDTFSTNKLRNHRHLEHDTTPTSDKSIAPFQQLFDRCVFRSELTNRTSCRNDVRTKCREANRLSSDICDQLKIKEEKPKLPWDVKQCDKLESRYDRKLCRRQKRKQCHKKVSKKHPDWSKEIVVKKCKEVRKKFQKCVRKTMRDDKSVSKNNARKFCKRKVRKSNSKSLKQSKKN